MLVLGIETSCDETAASIVEDGHIILSNVISSQTEIHKPYGGVFPEIACRSHLDMLIPIIDTAIKNANISKTDIDLIAVANGPGLIGALLVGLNIAKGLSLSLEKPFIGVNHVEAHLYASMMKNIKNLKFPALGVVLSGGHTLIIKILDIGNYQIIGTTIDDAIGESFDKVAQILGLSYPGGPVIEKLAKTGNPDLFDFKAGKVKTSDLDFSFSGLKTKVLYTVKGQKANKNCPIILKNEQKKDIAAAFQKTAFSDVIKKVEIAKSSFDYKAIYFGGGVTNSQTLREMVANKNFDIPTFWPEKNLSLDNAAMIAGLGYQKFIKKKKSDPFYLEAFARSNNI